MTKVAITGAAGNLGGLLVRGMKDLDVNLNLLIHQKDVADDLKNKKNISVFGVDLANEKSLADALENVDVIVHFAGVLFKANPEKFLPETNIRYFNNLLNIAAKKNVKRVILISFPHVECEIPRTPKSVSHELQYVCNQTVNKCSQKKCRSQEKGYVTKAKVKWYGIGTYAYPYLWKTNKADTDYQESWGDPRKPKEEEEKTKRQIVIPKIKKDKEKKM
jgi:thioester reductase-like protein